MYITNTNKLKRVSGSVDQFFYDGNGNMIADSLNGTYNISYDHRNLIVQLYYKRYVDENLRLVLRTFSEFYKYDDAGNRIKKVVMKYTGTAQNPEIEDSGDAPPNWNYELIQHYVRDIGGNELAVYNDTTVTFWNVYGIDNVGKINYSDNSWNYYLKDHLGSPRVVIDQNGDIISAEDLDMWGYRMADRSFQSDTTFYKYTGKERDVTTGYDYFGARYYDSRIGRWGQVEPLLEKYLSWSPYCYSINNPINLFDPNGKDPRRDQLVNYTEVIEIYESNLYRPHSIVAAFNFIGENHKYINTQEAGLIDMLHFIAGAIYTAQWKIVIGVDASADVVTVLGELVEEVQKIVGDPSGYAPEDPRSNLEGVKFGMELSSKDAFIVTKGFISGLKSYLESLKPTSPDDPSISRENVYIHENAEDAKRNPLPKKRPNDYSPYRGERPDFGQ